MSSLIAGILTFFAHALVLKLAVGSMGVPSSQNSLSKASSISLGLAVGGLLIGLIPLVSWPIYAALWVIVIMASYDLGFFKSLGVAGVQTVLKVVVWVIFQLFGLHVAFSNLLSLGF